MDNMKIIWNWKQQRNQVAKLLVGHFGGLGVVLGIERVSGGVVLVLLFAWRCFTSEKPL
jgi:hypothetical protein